MIQVLESKRRGSFDHGWLKTHHSFSFADFYDPAQMGFRSLRVINEDTIDAGMGFGTHPHRDMEIITYVTKGALEHKDSMGNRAVIKPGEVQYMSAGTGVLHSEYNPLPDQETHLFQIWILPEARGGDPRYGEKSFEEEIARKPLVLVTSRDGREGSISIRQDADLYVGRLDAGRSAQLALRPARGAWVQVVAGALTINGRKVESGDGVAVENESELKLEGQERGTEFLLFDLA